LTEEQYKHGLYLLRNKLASAKNESRKLHVLATQHGLPAQSTLYSLYKTLDIAVTDLATAIAELETSTHEEATD
jgi:hypothetical protein